MGLAKLLNNSGFFMFNNIQYPPRQVQNKYKNTTPQTPTNKGLYNYSSLIFCKPVVRPVQLVSVGAAVVIPPLYP